MLLDFVDEQDGESALANELTQIIVTEREAGHHGPDEAGQGDREPAEGAVREGRGVPDQNEGGAASPFSRTTSTMPTPRRSCPRRTTTLLSVLREIRNGEAHEDGVRKEVTRMASRIRCRRRRGDDAVQEVEEGPRWACAL